MLSRTITCLAIAGVAALTLERVHAQRPSGLGPEVDEGLARVRAATARFADLDSAVAAGYAREVPGCLAHSQQGAMGFHHANRAYMDAKIEIERPEILVYERLPDGRYTLNGVEYIIPYSHWPRDSVPPRVFDRNLKRADNLNLWYLHVWLFKENAKGIFADWNPAVHCGEH